MENDVKSSDEKAVVTAAPDRPVESPVSVAPLPVAPARPVPLGGPGTVVQPAGRVAAVKPSVDTELLAEYQSAERHKGAVVFVVKHEGDAGAMQRLCGGSKHRRTVRINPKIERRVIWRAL